MIEFNNISQEAPYKKFRDLYRKSLKEKQKNIEAICIASYSKDTQEAHARFVNLKFINGKQFIFFTNYNSVKAKDFISHDQITGLIYWNSINVQIRMKAQIKKTSRDFNQLYFASRDVKKNALAISSNQSSPIRAYKDVKENYDRALKEDNVSECPDYWGGYYFKPYYFEFWKGHGSRLNRREIFELKNDAWSQGYLQP